MDVESQMVEVPAAGRSMPAFLTRPKDGARAPCVLVIQEAFGLNDHIKDVTRRISTGAAERVARSATTSSPRRSR